MSAISDNFITFSEWSEIMKIKKDLKIKEYDELTFIELTKENKLFINVFKNMVNKKVFDLSRISYLALLFLDPYITPHLKNFLAIQNFNLTNLDKLTNLTKEIDYLPPLDNTITNILAIIIELIVIIELQLNLQLLILQIHCNVSLNTDSAASISSISSIRQSTMLLLLFKIINKFGKISNFIVKSLNELGMKEAMKKDFLDIIPSIQNNSKNINNLLDDFILKINAIGTHNQGTDGKEANNQESYSIWLVCKEHVINMARINLQLFETMLDILIRYLAIEHKEQTEKFDSIKKSIINFLELEINLFASKI